MDKELKVARDEYINKVKRRGNNVVCNSPFMSDAVWKQAVDLVYKRGPLSTTQMILFKQELETFARKHFLDLVFDLEIAYGTIAALSDE